MLKVYKFDDHTTIRDTFEKRKHIMREIQDELEAGRPVYARVPNGVYTGSIGRLKVKNCSFKALSQIFSRTKPSAYAMTDSIKFQDVVWELELDDTNRTFKINWEQIGHWKFNPRLWTEVYLGRTERTVTYKKSKQEPLNPTLVDFMGREINDGDYVLAYSTYKELNDTGSPLRLVRYTGYRTKASARFIYLQMIEGNTEPGKVISVNLNHTVHPDQVFGVKVDVDEALAVAMKITDGDVSMFPLRFSVNL